MAISFQRYVSITSGVGASASVAQRDLIGRLFTTNPLLPTKSYIEFNNAEDVGTYFGTSSEEYKRAAFYFGFISKNTTQAKKISYARWANAATAPLIYGAVADRLLATFTAISDGAFSLRLGADTNVISGLNFGAAGSLSAVAAIIQTAIRAAESYSPLWENATVSYDATRKSFNLVGGATGANVIATGEAETGTEIVSLLGWLESGGAILSDGVAIESITTTLTESAEASDNFGSFLFLPALSIEQIEEAAIWNNISTNNVKYQYCVPVLKVNASEYYDTLKDYAGVGVTISETSNEYAEMVPMIILAATDYNRRNSVQNYMFQQFTLTPSVTTKAAADIYDALRANYYGRTQSAGRFLDFYQRGTLMGLPTAPVDMNVYANEQWLKDAAGASIMELILSLPKVSANAQGRSQLIATLQSVINRALFNGTISVGKVLNNTQKLYVTNITGDDLAWHQVQNIGYWLDCVIVEVVTESNAREYKAVYSLVYSKDDVIRKVEGSHILI